MRARTNVLLIVGGKYHDMDFARLELLKLLAEHAHLRVRVAENYADAAAIAAAEFLITYTCDVIPPPEQQPALVDFFASGKRWFALHGTNSVLKWSKALQAWEAPRFAPDFMHLLGSQFIAHPPIALYRVNICDREHPLTRGIEPFDADDELYLCEIQPGNQVLMDTEFAGQAPGFVQSDWSTSQRQPVLYVRQHGAGELLYCALGHCRGHFDMQPLIKHYAEVERGSWKLPVFHELLRRGIAWGARLDDAVAA